jgi:dipeptidyl aminopeptidase/acylaminoacyl peptidase
MVGGPGVNSAGTHLGFVSEAPDRPPEAWVTELSSFEPVQVSRVQSGTRTPVGQTDVIRWNAPDGEEVEGLLTYPEGYSPDRPVPLLVIVHGGPTGVFTQSYLGTAYQYPTAVFASEGYAVLRPNPRGSSGYGREFRYANYEDWGGGDYEDILAGVDAVIEMGVADPDRLGVMGWSYGGYMTSWIVTQTNRFRAASIGAALPNLISFSGTSDVPGFIPDYFGGEYWEIPERWQAHSPLHHVGGTTTPSLIQHGEEDVRVPVGQAYEFHNALVRQGVESKLVVYPRQPHGIREPKLLLDAMTRNLEWFERWVLRHDPVVP